MERLAKIEEVLLIANKKIDIKELRTGCSYGVPESLRPLVWRLLLHYLPLERQKWQSYLAVRNKSWRELGQLERFQEQRHNYDQMIEQIIVEPGTASLGQKEQGQSEDNDHVSGVAKNSTDE